MLNEEQQIGIAKGVGKVSPNPLVGAVIVKDGKLIAEGYHEERTKMNR